MKISRYFKLGVTQHEIDFVDIDIDNDTPVFIDPHFLAIRTDWWSKDATRGIRSFFRHFLALVRAGNKVEALNLFLSLREPNETRLGLSKGRSQGRGVGEEDARKIFNSLLSSKAVQSGLVEDIEDCRIFVDGVDRDKTSDMATNIIRKQLIAYSQRQCRLWNIPLTPDVPSGKLWNRAEKRWDEGHTEMLVLGTRKLLLVPKGIVAYSLAYTPQRYHQHFVLNYLQSYHLSINSALVKQRKPKKGRPGEKYVTKKSIAETEAPFSKEYIARFTQSHPDVFKLFKGAKVSQSRPLDNHELTDESVGPVIDRLMSEIRAIRPGNEEATRYHRTIAAALELIFYPRLVSPEIEKEINEGRKRIDLMFDNAAETGFFYRLHTTYQTSCQFIKIECKNYTREIANPELDQMVGRFDPNTGKFGLIVCRSLEDEELFLKRCNDSYRSQHGIILPLNDADILQLLSELKRGREHPEEDILMAKYRRVAVQ
ncbi:MAG: hypothetical protein ACREIG_00100 [Nitrospiraceae bacterium]